VFPQVRHLMFKGPGVDLHSFVRPHRRFLVIQRDNPVVHENDDALPKRQSPIHTGGAGGKQYPRGKPPCGVLQVIRHAQTVHGSQSSAVSIFRILRKGNAEVPRLRREGAV